MELLTKYSVGDIIYFLWNGDNYDIARGVVRSFTFDGTNIYYVVCQVNAKDERVGSNYQRFEKNVFRTLEEAKLSKIVTVLKEHKIDLDDVIKLVPNISLWKESLSKGGKVNG